MSTSSQKSRSIPHESQALPKGRIVTLGASARKRERVLLTSLIAVSFVLVGLLGTEAWMFQKGLLVLNEASPLLAAAQPSSASMPSKINTGSSATTAANKPVHSKQHTQTVAATMAPTPASGKYEDIILPAERPSASDSNVKAEASKPVSPHSPASLKISEAAKPAAAPIMHPPLPAPLNTKAKLSNEPTGADDSAPQPGKSPSMVIASPKPAAATGSTIPIPAVSTKFKAALDDAQASLEKNDYAGALAIYDRVLDRDSKNIAALKGKAYALQQTEQYQAAIDIDRQLLKLTPHDKATDIKAQIKGLEQALKSQ